MDDGEFLLTMAVLAWMFWAVYKYGISKGFKATAQDCFELGIHFRRTHEGVWKVVDMGACEITYKGIKVEFDTRKAKDG